MLAAGGWFPQGAGAKGAGGKPSLILLGMTSCLWSSFQLSHNAVMQRAECGGPVSLPCRNTFTTRY